MFAVATRQGAGVTGVTRRRSGAPGSLPLRVCVSGCVPVTIDPLVYLVRVLVVVGESGGKLLGAY